MRRAEAGQRRDDSKSWRTQRRERTRQLIELGGLVSKAGLVDLIEDRAALYGALLEIADKLADADKAAVLALWRRQGRRAFEAQSASEATPT